MKLDVGINQDLLVFDLNCTIDCHNLLLSVLLRKESHHVGTSLFSNSNSVKMIREITNVARNSNNKYQFLFNYLLILLPLALYSPNCKVKPSDANITPTPYFRTINHLCVSISGGCS